MSLRTAPLSVRVFATSILATLGLGYLLAMVYLYATKVRPHQLQGHGLIQGVEYSYHGKPAESRLISSLKGSMAATITPEEFDAISAWVSDGAPEETYGDVVGPIVENNCASCHDEGGYFPVITSFENVEPLTKADSGVDLKKLARMTHVHLLGIPLIFYILGALFVRTRYPEKLKAWLVVLPFVAIIWDIAHWWITKANPSAALGIILGGALMGVGFAAQWGMSLWDVWAPLRDDDSDAPVID